MKHGNARSTRRAFFLQGGAVVGTGIAATVSASASLPPHSLSGADREAILQLHRAFMMSIEHRQYDLAASLFLDPASLTTQYREQNTGAFHSAYRVNPSHPNDVITLSEDGVHAIAIFHVETEVCTPLEDSCTAAQMARLQGNVASRHWESGSFHGRYLKIENRWKIASLRYVTPSPSR
jgi:hypothetical protein